MNKAQLIGRLEANPESRESGNGKTVTNLRVATTETWNDKTTGDRKTITDFHTVVAFGDLATRASKSLLKGNLVYVEGKIKTTSYQDKDGVKRINTSIYADKIDSLAPASAPPAAGNQPPQLSQAPSSDDFPF